MMPLYEYYCESCDEVFEALRSVGASEEPAPCATCGREAERIMPTTFASMSRREGWAQRVPYHHKPVRAGAPARTIARVKPRAPAKRKPKAEGDGD
jgi:putative FmdB family regulatory protein